MARPSKFIKQGDLEAALNARLVVETLERQLKEAKDERDRIELVLVARLKQNDPVQPGELDALVQPNEGKRNVKWKEEFAKLAGPDAVEATIARTPKTPGEDKLVISRGAVVVKSA